MSRKNEEQALAAWTQTPPTEQGTYWHWNGDEDCAPVPMFVLWSGTESKCFVSAGQLGIKHAVMCEDYGGWWLKNQTPNIPREGSMSPPVKTRYHVTMNVEVDIMGLPGEHTRLDLYSRVLDRLCNGDVHDLGKTTVKEIIPCPHLP